MQELTDRLAALGHAPAVAPSEATVLSDVRRGRSVVRSQRWRRGGLAIAVTAGLTLVATQSLAHAGGGHLRWRLVGDVSGPWQTVSNITPQAPDFHVYCPSVATCYVLGSNVNGPLGQMLVTDDGGQHWSTVDLPVQLGSNSAMSCADAGTCAILGAPASGGTVLLETDDGGQDWSTEPGPPQLSSGGDGSQPGPNIGGLTCTSASNCTAVQASPGTAASDAFTTSNGGATWSGSALPVTVDVSLGMTTSPLQCLSNGTCIVTGFVPGSSGETLAAGYSTDGGATWQLASTPAGTYGVTSVSCPGTTQCLMVSYGGGVGKSTVLQSTDGGESWGIVPASGLPQALLTGISCPSSDDCWTSGGTTQPTFPFGSSEGLLASSTDGGQTWQQATLPSGISAVLGVSCPSAGTCYALAQLQSGPRDMTLVLLSNTSS